MKFSTRGFTLVELMIVIAIIGILAAALFPSLTAYLKRSRDAGRAANLNNIATAAGAFYSDRERYPDADISGNNNGCAGLAAAGSATGISTEYMPKGLPTDPQASNNNGCATSGRYGYGSGTISSAPVFFLVAKFENLNGGNTGAVYNFYTGTVSAVASPNTLSKGAGQWYLLQN